MQKTICLAFLWVGLGLSSCHSDQSATTAAGSVATADSPPTPPGADHSGSMAGMHPAPPAPASALLTAMIRMMVAMDSLPARGNTDYDFALMMRAHHRGAVEMATLELRDGQDPGMRELAATIKQDQQREQAKLTSALARLGAAPANYEPQNPADPFTRAMKASLVDMMKTMSAPANDPDLDFNQLMISHHQSAVDMAQAELAYGTNRQLQDMARQIIRAQQQEIQQLQQWQANQAASAN
jgi:uncharacterized protein (DUF305 family)